MASIRKRKRLYYARVTWREGSQKKEKQIPLRTNLKSQALKRQTEVEKFEHIVKKGGDYSARFPWLKGGGKTEIVRRTVQEAIDEYHVVKDIRNQRKSTIERSKVGLKTLTDVVGKTHPVGSLIDEDI